MGFNLSNQLRDWPTPIDDWRWTPIKIFDHRCGRINAEVMIDSRQEIASTANPFD
jgi:hypothetical protein